MTSSVSGDGTHAGFVAVEDSGTLNITNCLFDGSCGRLEDHPAYADLQSIIELEYNGLVCGSDYREDLFLP